MNFDELVQTITREVLRQMQAEHKVPCVMVLAPRDEKHVLRVRECLAEDVDVLFCGEDHGDRAVTRYLLPYLSCTDMADLATGRATDRFAFETLTLALRGETVEVLDYEYHHHLQTAPGPLYALYEGYEKILASFGVKAFCPRPPEMVVFRHDLLTARDVQAVGEQGGRALRVTATAKITPLAAETAANLHIAIVREG